MDIREILALNLRKLRAARGISQEELAHRAEIDRTYISALERSVYAASIDVLDTIARVLNVEASDLLKRPAPTATKKVAVQQTIECKTKK
ncbi:helix-turn-helix domain-containing protein [Bradyrhizobium valentinum]|uniref:helix-turn-helix domain-containing protein n=1 Tax=Bradyrhizobium valentinum TaxID=1518501 RepID=UPI0009EA595F|nr:helix-turn-helix transcriptional regulator [Bradyrhizobium valentinum]